MPAIVDPDPEWYLDNVLAVAEPGIDRLGPVRSRQGEWTGAAADLMSKSAGTATEAATRTAVAQGFTLAHAQARARGLRDADIRRLVRRGDWTAPRRSILSPLPPQPASPSPGDALRTYGDSVQVAASAAVLGRPGAVVSHESAAALHGLPLLTAVQRPTLTAVELASVIDRPDVVVRSVGLGVWDVELWFGVPVTTIERTVVDVARKWGVAAGLVAADAALNDRLTTSRALRTALERAHRRPGVRSAQRAIELGSPLAVSPLESLSRLCLIDGGLPAPELQVWIATTRGQYRVDMFYRRARVVIEADGDLKYRTRPALVDEKRRQEALERAGFIVVRVTWADVHNDAPGVVERVRWALARGMARR